MKSSALVRPAVPEDAIDIAKVHIKSWQEAYQGMIQQSYLDRLPLELEARIAMWKRNLANPQRWTWVGEVEHRIIGFCIFGPPRDSERDGSVELGAIYLLASEQGKGIGRSLLTTGFHKMKELGYAKAYCWVLANNPTIKFYEKSGAVFGGFSKDDEIDGMKYKELAYNWNSLDCV